MDNCSAIVKEHLTWHTTRVYGLVMQIRMYGRKLKILEGNDPYWGHNWELLPLTELSDLNGGIWTPVFLFLCYFFLSGDWYWLLIMWRIAIIGQSSLPRSHWAKSAVDIYYGRKKSVSLRQIDHAGLYYLPHLLPYYNHLKAHAQ